jgi:hypothetical protein
MIKKEKRGKSLLFKLSSVWANQEKRKQYFQVFQGRLMCNKTCMPHLSKTMEHVKE